MASTLQFDSWPQCCISILFWKVLSEKKLNELKLGRAIVPITAFYQLAATKASLLLTRESFAASVKHVAELGEKFVSLPGVLLLTDTLDELKKLDFQQELAHIMRAKLPYFVLFAYADVKRYKFTYLIWYPVPVFKNEQISVLKSKSLDSAPGPAMHEAISNGTFMDPSIVPNVPGWPLRQYLSHRALTEPGAELQIACCRLDGCFELTCRLPRDCSHDSFGGLFSSFKTSDISAVMDPKALALQASELNLKLMKWRIAPKLDLETIKGTKCLLLGSGTLGCAIARVLLGWGIKQMTLVDNGNVSYSNPVRQSLFTFEDAKASAPKAHAAARRAAEIDPNAVIAGEMLDIPMPGHSVLDEGVFAESLDRLEALVRSHDVVFLLTDSRESRWLPSVIGSVLGKRVITVGLGFDSYVVLRHGNEADRSSCYFCQDVVGPGDSLSHRSIDQQCTVTRPGLAFMAAALAVELLVSSLQPDMLANGGAIPHQIRGSLFNFAQMSLEGSAFAHCTACSAPIRDAYQQDRHRLVRGACNDAASLAELSGLSTSLASVKLSECVSIAQDEGDAEEEYVTVE